MNKFLIVLLLIPMFLFSDSDIAESRIMNPVDEAVIVLGHDRNRAGVSAGAAGQHPYKFNWNDKTYTFHHNGYHDYKEPMYWYCYSYNSDWFDDYPLNWGDLGNNIYDRDTVCDTELLFHYIMAHVIEFNGDVIAGMIAAFNETAVYDSSGIVYNFQEIFRDNWNPNRINSVLSDGNTLYIFRNSNDAYPDYNLSYKEYDGLNEGFVGVKTYFNIPGGTQVQQYSLVVIPREGDIVTYENVFEIDVKNYSFPSQFTLPDCGWKWLSFDILDPEANNEAQYFLAPISAQDKLDEAWFKPHSQNSVPAYISYDGQNWHNGTHPITSPYGYKFHTFTDCEFTVIGERCPTETTFPLFGNNQENWIGYFLEETQHIYDAFADQLDNLTGIRGQHWALKKGSGWPDVPYTISPGDMVIAYCESDVPAFFWNFEESREKYVIPESQDFTYEEESDYIPVFIELDPNDLPSEIGAYVDGECKGATVVQDTSAQICAYILENQGNNLEFEFSYGSRELNKQIKEYGIYEPETSKTVRGTIQIDSSRDCYYVSFRDDQNDTPTPASIKITNFPNPFNPETTLFFSLPNEQDIKLTVYNIKGQKVKQLVSGQFATGEHSVVWEGKDDNGKQVSSGLYLYKLKTDDKIISKKMLLLK
ncbi:MAG: T9SS type A sorting domain-containing protein [Candidatus Cloacimonadota bacterium]|nr:T9SS type A sorting domain-containing protein [Candidatus Cloacimonadota bacterium]